MKIYTKTGDDGTTGLFNGARVSKSSLRVEAYGTVDELNAVIGVVVSSGVNSRLREPLIKLNNLLFNLGSDLATPLNPPPKFKVPRISLDNITFLENLIDEYDKELPKLKNFILPGGSVPTSFLHLARTVCRRAERAVVELAKNEEISDESVKFLNRLSDYLFTAARMSNFLDNIPDEIWNNNA